MHASSMAATLDEHCANFAMRADQMSILQGCLIWSEPDLSLQLRSMRVNSARRKNSEPSSRRSSNGGAVTLLFQQPVLPDRQMSRAPHPRIVIARHRVGATRRPTTSCGGRSSIL